jgi:hypothetical protein
MNAGRPVLSESAAAAALTLIIKVLPGKAGDPLEAGDA